MDVRFQLIYSDGGETGLEDMWKIYTVALMPYVFGIPVENVSLILFEGLLCQGREQIEKIPITADKVWLPVGYNEYFWQVYENGVGIGTCSAEYLSSLPAVDFRLISGHGFHDYARGGRIRFGNLRVPFNKIGPNATVLTILDVCSSPSAVATFSGIYPSDGKKFRAKHIYRDPDALLPVACDRSDTTWAFRVGYEHQDENDSNPDHWEDMTGPIGDAIVCCILNAVKVFMQERLDCNVDNTLHDLFLRNYAALRTGYLAQGTSTPKGFSNNLAELGSLIVSGKLPIRLDAFDCEIFKLSHKWFLTMGRTVELDNHNGDLADCIVTFVVDGVKSWHEQHPNSMEEIEVSRETWKRLLQTMGPFRERLRSIELEFLDDDDSSVLVVSNDGIPFELFAVACPVLPEFATQVRNWISTGTPFGGHDTDDETE